MSAVISERMGAIALLTLNSPEQYNALNDQRMAVFNEAIDAVHSDPKVRCIVLTGAGKGFCSGAQFGGDVFSSGEGITDSMRRAVSPIVTKLRTGPVPVVTAINGPAAGAGVGFALAGDIAIAARSARFLLSFARLGAVLDGGTSQLLQRSIGAARARYLALTGDQLDAETAAEWGLVWKCVDDAVLMDEAMAVADRLANGPPLALAMIRQQLDAAWTAPLGEILDLEAELQGKAFVTADLREGATAFMEKRAPRFTGA